METRRPRDTGGFLRLALRKGGGNSGLSLVDPGHPIAAQPEAASQGHFIIGENGAGKSTLNKALAQVSGFDEQGGSRNRATP